MVLERELSTLIRCFPIVGLAHKCPQPNVGVFAVTNTLDYSEVQIEILSHLSDPSTLFQLKSLVMSLEKGIINAHSFAAQSLV